MNNPAIVPTIKIDIVTNELTLTMAADDFCFLLGFKDVQELQKDYPAALPAYSIKQCVERNLDDRRDMDAETHVLS